MTELYELSVIIAAIAYLLFRYMQPGNILDFWLVFWSKIILKKEEINYSEMSKDDIVDLAKELSMWISPLGGCVLCFSFWVTAIFSGLFASSFYDFILLFSFSNIIILCLVAIKR